jgi:hypothetical protein
MSLHLQLLDWPGASPVSLRMVFFEVQLQWMPTLPDPHRRADRVVRTSVADNLDCNGQWNASL